MTEINDPNKITEPRGISLPIDMWAYLTQRKAQTGVPVSTYIRRLIENDITQSARRLVDSPTQYTTETAGRVR